LNLMTQIEQNGEDAFVEFAIKVLVIVQKAGK
jgi:hypothetical protein